MIKAAAKSILANFICSIRRAGCGGWLNTDYEPELPIVMHLDASQRFPFREATFDYIFSEHVIEHISYWDGMKMLAECFRVLKGSGKVRISTPDLAFLVDLTNLINPTCSAHT
jgi:predicted SAM-dependent methyltransferase